MNDDPYWVPLALYVAKLDTPWLPLNIPDRFAPIMAARSAFMSMRAANDHLYAS